MEEIRHQPSVVFAPVTCDMKIPVRTEVKIEESDKLVEENPSISTRISGEGSVRF